MNIDFTIKMMKWLFNNDLDYGDKIGWDEDLNFYANCNDFFAWGCADGEPITEETLPILEKSIKDLNEFKKNNFYGTRYGHLLYCARMRKMRPQGAYYKVMPIEIWHFFDKCGEPRPSKIGNPVGTEELNKIKEMSNNKIYLKKD